MSITVGTNSWVTIAEADTYFSTRFNADDWDTFAELTKKKLLITAYNWIQGQTQFSISPTSTDDKVKQAQYEAAWYLYNYMDETEDRRALYAQGVREFEVSKFMEKVEAPVFPGHLEDLLSDFTTSAGFGTIDRDFDSNRGA